MQWLPFCSRAEVKLGRYSVPNQPRFCQRRKTKTVRQLLRLYWVRNACLLLIVMKCMAIRLTARRTSSTYAAIGSVDSVLKSCSSPFTMQQFDYRLCLVWMVLYFWPIVRSTGRTYGLWLYCGHKACSLEDEDNFLMIFCFVNCW